MNSETEYSELERVFTESIGLSRRPVAISFLDEPPPGVEKFSGTEPAGCSFWRLAAAGRTFYTVAADHYNCPIGSYTHNLPLPPERGRELEQTLGLMSDIGYVRMEEVPGIPRLPQPPKVIVYSPLAGAPARPGVVLFTAAPGRLMLLQEAALRAAIPSWLPLMARPTCMAIPVALSGNFVASTGCIGNRVYTEIADSELYAAIPGAHLERVAAELGTIAKANATLADYHRGRAQTLRSE